MFTKQYRTLYSKIIFLLIFIVMGLSTLYSKLPDYASYQQIFEGGQPFGYTTFSFGIIVGFFRYLNVDYDIFRIILLLLGLLLAARLVHRYNEHASNSSVVLSVLHLYVLLWFLIEFYLIRLRAGVSFALFAFFFANFIGKVGVSRSKIAIPTYLVTSLFLHPATFFYTFLFVLPSLVIISRRRFFFSRSSLTVASSISALLVLFVSVYYIPLIRGENTNSELNIIRLLSYTVIPLYLFILSANVFIKKWIVCITPASIFIIHYLFFIIGICVMYVDGLISDAGEAIVRIHGTAAFVAIMLLQLDSSIRVRIFLLSLPIVDSLFFIRTLLL